MPPAPLTQNLDEVAFSKGLWAVITNGGSLPAVQAWLDKKGSEWKRYVDLPDKSGYTPLLYAARTGDLALCRFLVDHGASVARVTPGLLQSVLQRAVGSGNPDLVRLIVERGANPNHKDATGATALSVALKMEHTEIANILQPLTGPVSAEPSS